MTRVAWILAIFAVVGTVMIAMWTKEENARDRVDAAVRIETQRARADESLAAARGVVARMQAEYAEFENRAGEVRQQHEEAQKSWEQLDAEIAANDRAIDELAARKSSVVQTKEQKLAEIKEMQGKIGSLEQQISALQKLMVRVKKDSGEI